MDKYKRIAFEMTAWEWSMVSDALDNYILKNSDYIDCGSLTTFAEHIDEIIEIKNYSPDGKWPT